MAGNGVVSELRLLPIRDINNAGAVLLSDGNSTVVWQDGSERWLEGLPEVGWLTDASALNDIGEVVGTAFYATATLDRGDSVVDLGIPRGYTSSAALLINNASQVAGTLNDARTNRKRAFFWDRGQMTELAGFDDTIEVVQPTAMNDSGAVVGWSLTTVEQPPRPDGEACEPTLRQYRGFLWQDGTLTDLGPELVPTDINESNQIAGYTFDADDQQSNLGDKPFLWEDGAVTLIDVPGYPHIAPEPYAGIVREPSRVFINDRGQVGGTAYNPRTTVRAFIWQAGELIDLVLPGARQTVIVDMNNVGQATGMLETYPGRSEIEPVIWDVTACAAP